MPIEVGYWGIRGLAAPLRMMLMYTKTPFKNISYDLKGTADGSYDGSCWFANRKGELKAINPLVNLPYLIDEEGLVVTQSNACLMHLGRKLGIWGSTPQEETLCEQCVCEVFDLRNKMTGFAYCGAQGPAIKEAALKLLSDTSGPNSSLAKLELLLASNHKGKGTFLVTDHATPADFHLFEMLDQYIALAALYQDGAEKDKWINTFPKLKAYHGFFRDLPGMQAYLASNLNKLPFNNKMAVFGSHPNVNDKYTYSDAPPDWHGTTGDYHVYYDC